MRIQNKFVDEFNKMRPEVRRKTHFVGSPARRGRRTVHGEWSRAELITWARTNGIKSKDKLWRWTADPAHKSDPSVYLIRKTFGSWEKFIKEAFGVQPQDKKQWPEDLCRYIQNPNHVIFAA